jgi:hypothetical protein
MEALFSSGTLVDLQQTTWPYISEEGTLQSTAVSENKQKLLETLILSND